MRTHEDASMAKDAFHWGGGSRNTVHGAHKSTQGLELIIAEEGLDSSIR